MRVSNKFSLLQWPPVSGAQLWRHRKHGTPMPAGGRVFKDLVSKKWFTFVCTDRLLPNWNMPLLRVPGTQPQQPVFLSLVHCCVSFVCLSSPYLFQSIQVLKIPGFFLLLHSSQIFQPYTKPTFFDLDSERFSPKGQTEALGQHKGGSSDRPFQGSSNSRKKGRYTRIPIRQCCLEYIWIPNGVLWGKRHLASQSKRGSLAKWSVSEGKGACSMPSLMARVWTPGPTWQKEGTDSHELSSALHMHTSCGLHAPPHR